MNKSSFMRVKAIFIKETKHILRDPFTIGLAVLIPFVQVLILGYSVEFNLSDIKTAVVDQNRSYESQELICTFNSSGYFKTHAVKTPEEGFKEVKSGKAKALVVIPTDFNEKLSSGQAAPVQVMVDGTDNSSVSAVQGYLQQISERATRAVLKTDAPKDIFKIRLLFNPELNSQWFIMPGLATMILSLVAILMTALTVCREWELGSMELLLSTPVQPKEILLGKVGPYMVLSFMTFLITYLATRLIFRVPFAGSHLVLLAATFIFIFDYLAIGLFISVTSRQQQIAVQYVNVIGMLPAALLSGFVFPIEYMPKIMQYFTMLFPARYYLEISRSEFLKAVPMNDLWVPFAAMAVQGFLVCWLTLKKFKRNLE